MPFGLASGSGVIFGSTGGVSEAVVTRLLKDKPDHLDKDVIFKNVRGMEDIKEAIFNIEGKEVRVAIVHGLKSADKLVKHIKSGERHYDFVEVMACKGGCIAGGGQPAPVDINMRRDRAKGLYKIDRTSFIKSSEYNPLVTSLFDGLLKDKKDLIHVHKDRK
jgi:NADH-quinone oxidoreductase subunit G